jgi:hypothetical protein
VGLHPLLRRAFHHDLLGGQVKGNLGPPQVVFPPPDLGLAQKHNLVFIPVIDRLFPGGHPVALDIAHVAPGFDAVDLLTAQVSQGGDFLAFLGRGRGGPVFFPGFIENQKLVSVQGGVTGHCLNLSLEDDEVPALVRLQLGGADVQGDFWFLLL